MKITGHVRDKTSKRPIERATVRLALGDREIAKLVSGSSGHFSHEDRATPIGRPLTITAIHKDFQPQCVTETTSDDLHVHLELERQRSWWSAIIAFLSGLLAYLAQIPRKVAMAAIAALLLLGGVALGAYVFWAWWTSETPVVVASCTSEQVGAALRDADADAMFALGTACVEQGGEQRDIGAIERALRLFSAGADKGDARAALSLGLLYDPNNLRFDRASNDVVPTDDRRFQSESRNPVVACQRYVEAAGLGSDLAPGLLQDLEGSLEELSRSGDALAEACLQRSRRITTGAATDGAPDADGYADTLRESIVGTARADAAEPLRSEKIPDLFQRIITLPDAQLYDADREGVIVDQLPVFSVYYVYDRLTDAGEEWVQVGESIEQPDGWMAAADTQPWDLMMVMRYAPRGMYRERVLFFEEDPEDEEQAPPRLQDLVLSFEVEEEAKRLLERIETGDLQGSGLAAVETERLPEERENPYLMPILGFERSEFDNGVQTNLLKVASINAAASATQPAGGDNPEAIAAAKRAIVFVFDTTVSMKPYIEETERFAQLIHDRLQEQGLGDQLAFGLVGFRDYMGREPQATGRGAKPNCPGVEYVSRVYHRLEDPPKEFVRKLEEEMDVSCVSTRGWDEDAVAGLYSAINDLNWDPFGELRLIILVTDAGARDASDELAQHPGYGITTIQQMANENDIAIVPIHLHTPEAVKANNIEHAREQYERLGVTGDLNLNKYFPLEPSGPEPVPEFRAQLATLADQVVMTLEKAARGVPEEPPEPPENRGEPITLGKLFQNELYSAQQRYLGAVEGAQAPVFYRAWASDRDLTNPHPLRHALLVSVFLSRNQVSELALHVDRLLELAQRGEKGPEGFFDELRALAASTVTDPKRYGANFERIAVQDLLPSYLKELPYRSDFLQMTKDEWTGYGLMRQQEHIEELRAKISFYHELEGDDTKWIPLGTGGDQEEVSLIPLAVLP